MLGPWSQKADVIVSHMGDSERGHKAARARKKPSVRIIHGNYPELRQRLLRHGAPALTVFNSHALQDSLKLDSPSIVCHPVLDVERFRTTPGSCITLVNLKEDKGGIVFDQLARYLPGRKFLGVQGGYGDQYEVKRPNVEIIRCTQNMRDDVYRRTGILVMPSKQETFGMVAAEAMCSGIPVIAHPTDGLKECLGPAGLYADRDDLDAWLDIIEDLDQPAKWKRQSKKCEARARVLADDNQVERFVKEVEALL